MQPKAWLQCLPDVMQCADCTAAVTAEAGTSANHNSAPGPEPFSGLQVSATLFSLMITDQHTTVNLCSIVQQLQDEHSPAAISK